MEKLENMSLEQLYQLKEKWYNDSIEEKILHKIGLILNTLSDKNRVSPPPDNQRLQYKIKKAAQYDHTKVFSLEPTDAFIVYYGSKRVFDQGDKLFVPGKWYEQIDILYQRACEQVRKDLINDLSLK